MSRYEQVCPGPFQALRFDSASPRLESCVYFCCLPEEQDNVFRNQGGSRENPAQGGFPTHSGLHIQPSFWDGVVGGASFQKLVRDVGWMRPPGRGGEERNLLNNEQNTGPMEQLAQLLSRPTQTTKGREGRGSSETEPTRGPSLSALALLRHLATGLLHVLCHPLMCLCIPTSGPFPHPGPCLNIVLKL